MTKVTTKVIQGARPEAIWEKRGGQAVGGLGYALLFGGLGIALVAALVIQWFFPAGILGFVVGAVLLLATAPLGIAFRRAAAKLTQAGADRERTANLETIDQLAQATGTGVTVDELARVGGVTEARADVILTELANAGDLRLEVSDEGVLLYYPKVSKLRVGVPAAQAINYAPGGPPAGYLDGADEAPAAPTKGNTRSPS